MKQPFLFLSLLVFFASACIGDDIIEDSVPERLSINNALDSIQINTTFQFEATFFNNIGQAADQSIEWMSTNEAVLSIDAQGLATAHTIGGATVRASVLLEDNSTVSDEMDVFVSEGPTVEVEETTERSGLIRTTSSYVMTGDFTLTKDGDDLILDIADNYQASTGLPGLYVYLTNNPNTTNGALEISKVSTFNGAHSYTITGVDIDDYNYLLYFCKPFNVKVGDGEID